MVGNKFIRGFDSEFHHIDSISMEELSVVELVTYEGGLSCLYNGIPLVSSTYTKLVGSLRGIRIEFKVDGKVDYLCLGNSHTDEITYFNDFEP